MNRGHETDEAVFRALARSYVQLKGEELKKEASEMIPVPFDFSSLEMKMRFRLAGQKREKKSGKILRTLLPLAACLLLVVALFRAFLPANAPSKPTPPAPSAVLDYAFIAEKLPGSFTLRQVDYDNEKAVYYIEGERDGDIVLVAEETGTALAADGLERIRINGASAYIKIEDGYNLVKYERDGVLYTLTNRYDFDSLLLISKNIL